MHHEYSRHIMSMMHHEYSYWWCIMSTHDASWILMMHHENWWCVGTHDVSWALMMHHEYSWSIKSRILRMHPICHQMARHGSWEDLNQTNIHDFSAPRQISTLFKFEFPLPRPPHKWQHLLPMLFWSLGSVFRERRSQPCHRWGWWTRYSYLVCITWQCLSRHLCSLSTWLIYQRSDDGWWSEISAEPNL